MLFNFIIYIGLGSLFHVSIYTAIEANYNILAAMATPRGSSLQTGLLWSPLEDINVFSKHSGLFYPHEENLHRTRSFEMD